MSKTVKTLKSDIAWSTPDRITIRGKDLPSEILGHFNLGDFAYFQLTGRVPTPQQSTVFKFQPEPSRSTVSIFSMVCCIKVSQG